MSGKPGLSLREVTGDDLDIIRSLYVDVWGYSRPPKFDRWRLLDTPDGVSPAVLAMDGSRPVGFYTVWPLKIRLAGSIVLGAQSMDTMTHPNYQGQGVFTKLANACYELSASRGYKILYGFPNPSSYPGFTRRLAWKHTGDIAHWVRPVCPSRHSRVPGLLGPFADAVASYFPKGGTRGMEISIGKPPPDALFKQIGAWHDRIGGNRIDRTSDWMDWRYSDRSENNYEWVCAYRHDALVAFGVWGMQNENWDEADHRAHLVELCGADKSARQAVLASIIDRAWDKSAILIETMSNIGEVTATLRRAGFIKHRQAPLIIRSLGDTILDDQIYDHASWQFMGGDVDTF